MKRQRKHRFLCGQGGVGMYRRAEYRAWWNMVGRCTDWRNANWERYGARGIRVCDQWRESFEAFHADMGPRPSRDHSIDRINPYGNYEPTNCRWATRRTQATNHRESRGHVRLTIFGITRSIAQWARASGIAEPTLRRRLRDGWLPPLAVATPVTPTQRKSA